MIDLKFQIENLRSTSKSDSSLQIDWESELWTLVSIFEIIYLLDSSLLMFPLTQLSIEADSAKCSEIYKQWIGEDKEFNEEVSGFYQRGI